MLSARIVGGALLLEGQDFTALAADMFGDEEYEYYYSFDGENTKKFAAVLGGNDLLKALQNFFGGEMKNGALERFCHENGIEYRSGSV